ncbi:MAG: hypothetical protein ACT6TH_14485 [Brevundimonas sp.]|uniref:hypothetical protein n=1 Tax=Brevundimonas sp. TaxID=1871086 RepID=UPI004034297D
MTQLPRNTTADYGDFPFCPWCREAPYELTVSLEALMVSLQRGLGHWVEVEPDGSTDADIVCDCPHCSKPFAVALKAEGVVLIPVRTEADRRLLAGEGRA